MPCADGKERGSLPNLDELAAQELYIKREEAAKLVALMCPMSFTQIFQSRHLKGGLQNNND